MNETKKFSGLVTSFLHKIFFLFFKSWCKMANFLICPIQDNTSLRSYTNMLISQCLHLQEIKAQGFKSSSSTSFRIYKLSKWISSAWPFIPMGIFQNQVLNAKGMINVKWQVNNYELRYKIVSMLYSNREDLLTFWLQEILLETTELLGTQRLHTCCTNSCAHHSQPTLH